MKSAANSQQMNNLFKYYKSKEKEPNLSYVIDCTDKDIDKVSNSEKIGKENKSLLIFIILVGKNYDRGI
jgi:hypothetical protein